MTSSAPRVSIGIPVHQGADYLDEAMTRALSQDYIDLEVIVSDNASADATPSIISRYARSDPRVRNLTQVRNIGAAENYNAVFHVSKGEYFSWNAHDDYASSNFVTEAVAALDTSPDAVVAIAHSFLIDPRGQKIRELPVPRQLIDSDSPAVRLRYAARADPEVLVFGVFRRSVLERTALHAGFTGSDRNLAAEVMLHGRAVWAGASEFYVREHENRSVRRLDREREGFFQHPREAWYAPERADRIVFPAWRRLGGYLAAVRRARLGFGEELRGYAAVVRLLCDDRFRLSKYLVFDLVAALARMLWRMRRLRPLREGE